VSVVPVGNVLPTVTDAAVISTVAGEHTAEGLVITRLGVWFTTRFTVETENTEASALLVIFA